MDTARESSIKNSILKRLKQVPGLVVRKRHGTVMGIAGDPDIYGLHNGRHFEIEIKVPGEHPTKLQELKLEQWRRAGAIVGVARNVADALSILGIEG